MAGNHTSKRGKAGGVHKGDVIFSLPYLCEQVFDLVEGLTFEDPLVVELLGHVLDSVAPSRVFELTVTLRSISISCVGRHREREISKEGRMGQILGLITCEFPQLPVLVFQFLHLLEGNVPSHVRCTHVYE